jgi:hypothetical protein
MEGVAEMMIWLPESELDLDHLAASSLILGGPYSGGLKALRAAVAQAVRQGKRVYCFDGQEDWMPDDPPEGVVLRRHSRLPDHIPPMAPAGELPVFSVGGLRLPDDAHFNQLWFGPQPLVGGADFVVFSRPSLFTIEWRLLLGRIVLQSPDRLKIVMFLDGVWDRYLSFVPLFEELIVYPHDASPELLEGMAAGLMSAREFDQIPPGQFVRIPAPSLVIPHVAKGSLE